MKETYIVLVDKKKYEEFVFRHITHAILDGGVFCLKNKYGEEFVFDTEKYKFTINEGE